MPRIRKPSKRRRSSGALTMKFRIIVHERMPRSVMFAKLDEFVSTGFMPDGIDVEAADYAKGYSARFRGGQQYRDIGDVTRLYNAFKEAQSVRFERVSR